MEGQINKPKGVFGASTISQLLAGGTGKTRMSCILDRALDRMEMRKDFQNSAMIHGVDTEQSAYDNRVKHIFPNSIYQSNIFIPINSECGASPDVLWDINNVLDIKCPTLYTFAQEVHPEKAIPKSYKEQLQMQLLATKGDTAVLFYYLSRPVTWQNGDSWEQYPFESENDDHFYITIQKDEDFHEVILNAVEKAVPERNMIFDKLCESEILEFRDFFGMVKNGKVPKKIKEAPSLEYLMKKDIFIFDSEFYYWQN